MAPKQEQINIFQFPGLPHFATFARLSRWKLDLDLSAAKLLNKNFSSQSLNNNDFRISDFIFSLIPTSTKMLSASREPNFLQKENRANIFGLVKFKFFQAGWSNAQ